MVILKNGQVLIGSYLNEDDKKIKFQVFKEIKTIAKSDISSFELGYSGVPVCYQLQNKWSQTCGDVIHILDKNKMVLGKGAGLLEKEELQLKDLKKITLKKSKKEERIFFILRPGLNLTVSANGKNYTGEIQSVNFETMSIKTKSETVSFKENDVEEVSWQGSSKASLAFLRYVVPGLFQFQEGKRFKGILLGFLFLGFAGAIGAEFSAAQSALNNDTDYIIINNSLYIGSNIFPNQQYDKHIRGMNYAIAGLTLVYLYHSYEVYSFTTSKGVKASIHMQMPSISSQAFTPDIVQGKRSNGIEFRISYSF
ncbi:MAG TPA: hypothetical protein PK079_16965 [Leptospiraceae bacterium]|nr:hypothetical protein [Leptospiraceae bacterium]HMX30742.1 hypothetical protein [Leptospiraceae bacterium]HMY31791.1 hypothetical protein [Leptospiraceae bacterium]HNA07730.1 hypothetical protein [Leptospiraceae bacterium]HNC55689.1 hypothetical protein [Leptospiraceae bacterium]